MVDPFLDPLDTAPVERPNTLFRRQREPVNGQPDQPFDRILSNKIDQEPTPIMTPDALLVPPLSSIKKDIVTQPSGLSGSITQDESSEILVKPGVLPPMEVSRKSEPVPDTESKTIQPPIENLARLLNVRIDNKNPNPNPIPIPEDTPVVLKPEIVAPPEYKPVTEPTPKETPFSEETLVPGEKPVPEENIVIEPEETLHTIQRGETLSGIVLNAMRDAGIEYDTGDVYRMVQVVAAHNQLSNPDRIYAGSAIDLSPVYSGQIIAEEKPIQSAWAGDIQAPVQGIVTSTFGNRIHPILNYEHFHTGVDIGVPEGTPVYPVKPGLITFSGVKSGYGNVVQIDHNDGTQSLYAHLSNRQVSEGDRIDMNGRIGLSGDTGRSTGPHLHLEIHQNGEPADPLSYISRDRFEAPPQIARGDTP